MTNKGTIVNDLSSWSLTEDGEFVGRGFFKTNFANLSWEESKEVRGSIINMIKKNPQEWQIKKWREATNSQGSLLLVNKSAILNYNDQGEVEMTGMIGEKPYLAPVMGGNTGKVHCKDGGFTEREWQELENIIKNAESIIKQNQSESKLGEYAAWTFVVTLVGVIILGILGIIFWKNIRSLF